MRMKNAIKQIVRGIVSDAFDANRLSDCSNNFKFLKSQCAAGFFSSENGDPEEHVPILLDSLLFGYFSMNFSLLLHL